MQTKAEAQSKESQPVVERAQGALNTAKIPRNRVAWHEAGIQISEPEVIQPVQPEPNTEIIPSPDRRIQISGLPKFALLILKGGDLGGLNYHVRKRIIKYLERWFIVKPGRRYRPALKEVLERWGETGIRYRLERIEEANVEGVDVSQAYNALVDRDGEAFERWLTNLTGKAIGLKVPAKGRQRAIVRLAQSNAQMKFNQISGRWKLEKVVATEGVEGLKKILKLKKIERIEAYDISNLQGTDSVGAMVVWEKGQLDKKQYRRFKIKTVVGPNDFASLAEVLKRRFAYLSSSVIPPYTSDGGIQTTQDNKGSPSLLRPSRLRSTSYDRPRATGGQAVPRDGKTTDGSFVVLPDVVLIDGGKGQVNTIARVLKDYKVAVIGIAKGSHSRTKARDELILWKPSSFAKASEDLRDNSPTKMLLQNIRDEVHRFAVAYHTSLRKKRTITSGLEKIAGVGAVTRKKLIKAFGSMAGVKAASAGEIAKIVGEGLAKKIKNSL